MRVFISSTPEALCTVHPHVTVEAEYGDVVVEGSILTLAHHGKRSHNPPPCTAEIPLSTLLALSNESDPIIGISHLDLDTLGGIMEVLSCKPHAPDFWTLVGEVDLKGPQILKLPPYSTDKRWELPVRQLYAYWAWNRENRISPPRDGSVADVTSKVLCHIQAVNKILEGDKEFLNAGEVLRSQEDALNRESFCGVLPTRAGKLIYRKSEDFVNFLYVTPTGELCDFVLAYNPRLGAITLSRRDESVPVNCCEVMKEAFGPKAGGHKGIAGSPRDEHLPEEAVGKVLKVLAY